MVKFQALQSAKVSEPKAPKGQSEPMKRPLEEKIIQQIRVMPSCTYDAMAEYLGVSHSTVKRTIKLLTEQGRIARISGKRYGHWVINE